MPGLYYLSSLQPLPLPPLFSPTPLLTSGVARAWRLGGKEVEWRFRRWDTYQNVRVGVIGSAEGAKLRLPKARSPSRLGGLGERRKLPQRGLGNRRDFEHFKSKWSTFWDHRNLTFLNNQI